MKPLVSRPCQTLIGNACIAGDKSISHRALIIGSMAVGETTLKGLLESADVMCTAEAMRALGAVINKDKDGFWRILGRGIGGLSKPSSSLDMGNSGTSARLLMGVLASYPFTTSIIGDASLSKRPMQRVITPMKLMGADVDASDGGRLPLTVRGSANPLPIEYKLPVASAQVKSAVLLAGLNTPGTTSVIEPSPTRDHSELMLGYFGAEVKVERFNNAGRKITLVGQPEISGRSLTVPGDFSSAAFPMVAALLLEGSKITLKGIGVNPLRTGLLDTLKEMGGRIALENQRNDAGEPVADIIVECSSLHGVDVPPERVPSMIDEFPVLAVGAALAKGETRMSGLAELRVKESDRLEAITRGLEASGVKVETGDDSMIIYGSGVAPPGGCNITVGMDHRIAMAFLVLGMACENPITIDDAAAIATSFPDFSEVMNDLGANIEETS